MMKAKLTLSFARLLRSLLDSELNYADFGSSSKKLLAQFLKDNVLDYRLIGRQQKKIYCPNAENLARYLQNKFEIPALSDYISFLEREDFERSDAVRAASDSKLRKTRIFTGFLVNCYEEIPCQLDAQSFCIKPASGAFTFISAYQTFHVPADITVIIVEGYENFREIERQKYLFEGLRPLFLWRYQNSNTIAEWLRSISNPYIHFGDFDPKGIHIYLSEFKNKVPGDRGRFLMPEGLEMLLVKYGEKDLYEKQKSIIPRIKAQLQEDLVPLIGLILEHKKGLAQEILIKDSV